LLIGLDLLFDESPGRVGVLALVTQTRLHEDGHERLDDALCTLRLGVLIRERKQIVTARTSNLERLAQIRDELFTILLALDRQVQIGHADQLFDVGTADQRPGQDGDLLIDVRLNRQARHQGLENGLGIDKDPRRGFIPIRHDINGACGERTNQPCRQQPPPAVKPHPAQVADELSEDIFHGSLLIDTGRRAPGV
jgi:hypothetical protein